MIFFLIMIVLEILIDTHVIPLRKKFRPIYLLFYAIAIIPLFISCFKFARGYSLAKEKEFDAVSTQGVVQEITKMPFPDKYYLNGKVVWSQYIIIDGIKYYCMTGNYVEIGDSVEIKYLPTSKYILELEISKE